MKLFDRLCNAAAAALIVALAVSCVGLLGLGFKAVADFLCTTPYRMGLFIATAGAIAGLFITPEEDEHNADN